MFLSLWVHLRALFFRRTIDAELDEELRYHLEREMERNIANGMSPLDARDAARRTMGNLSAATEQTSDACRWRPIEELRQDVAYAVRTCLRAPTFVLTVIGTIGFGLGLLVIAFTLFDAYVLRPAAVRDPGSLICAGVLLRAARETRAVSTGIRTRNIVQLLFLDRARGEAIRALRASPGVTMVASGDR